MKMNRKKNAAAPENVREFPISIAAAAPDEKTSIHIRVPLFIEVFGCRSDSEMQKIAACHLQGKAATLFRLIALLSESAASGDLNEVAYSDYCGTLAELGFGIMEAADLVELKREARGDE